MNNDHQLKQDILAELKWEPSISADHIGVTVENGVVTLSGHVNSFWQKQAAEDATGRVQGVKAIAEELEIRLPFDFKRADDEIASAAIDRLAWDASIPKDAVKVKVENGSVTLTGQVNWHYQKNAAEDNIRSLYGVTSVSNQLTTKVYPDIGKISDDIRKALHRSSFFGENVEVSAKQGEVHLSGNVDSWFERQTAMATAWAAPGTTSVVNNISIN